MKRYRIFIGTPFCNEEHSITLYVKGLLALDYPKELIDVLWVENNSSDNTWKILQRCYKDIKKKFKFHSFVLLQLTGDYGPLQKEKLGEYVHWTSGKVGPKTDLETRIRRAKHLTDIFNLFMEQARKQRCDFCLTILADCVVPPNIIKQYIVDMENIPDCGWIGGILHKRYPMHVRDKLNPSHDPLIYGLASPTLKIYDDTPLPSKDFNEGWMRRRWKYVKMHERGEFPEYPYPYGFRGMTEEEILERRKTEPIFEVCCTGHAWMVNRRILEAKLKFVVAEVESALQFERDMSAIGLKMYCDSRIYIKHISVDGKIYTCDIVGDSKQYFVDFLKSRVLLFNQSIPPRPVDENNTVYDGLHRRIINQTQWDELYGEWREFIENTVLFDECMKEALKGG